MNLRGIIIAVAVLVTASTITIIFVIFENNVAEQKQTEKLQARVHTLSDNGISYVRISDLAPNSVVYFEYPYSGNSTRYVEPYNSWILIRLPSDMGGDKNDISSYRSYNVVGVDQLEFSIRYFPTKEKLYEGHLDDTYDPVNGTLVGGYGLYKRHGNQTLPNALTKLDLGVDDQGYIYVKPPTFDIDKNGIIGLGRKIS